MTTLLILFLISPCALLMFLDVYSSSNRFFRLPDGRCNVKKLAVVKTAIFAACLTAALIFYFALNAGVIAFGVFPMMAVVSIPTILKNFKLHRKYDR